MTSSQPVGSGLRTTKPIPAKWDDDKTRVFLELIEGEIVAGNRPAGVLSKQGWRNLVSKIYERTGSAFTKDQLKNKQDNLRREYTKWESLIGKETGLGWDPVRRTLTAPDEWWAERAQVDPFILRYKESGPIHLDLFQKVFGGVTATGYRAYIPELSPDPIHSDEQNVDAVCEGEDSEVEPIQPVVDTQFVNESEPVAQTEQVPMPSRLHNRKRKRRSGVNKHSQADVIHSDMESITQTIKASLEALNSRRAPVETGLSYEDALQLLEGLPGMGMANPLYWKAIRVLEDKVRRIAFGHVLKAGVEAVTIWLSTFPDVF